MLISISSSALYHYGAKSPVGNDVPEFAKALTFKEAKLSFPQYPHTDYIYGVLSYTYLLPAHIIKQFNLADLNKSNEHMQWEAFVELARDRKKKMTLQEFQRDYITTGGKFVKRNPLFNGHAKVHSFHTFDMLSRYTSHKANFAGLTAFWESL